MSESTLTPEQANELAAKHALVDSLDEIREHAVSARDRAQEIVDASEEVLRAIPDGVTVENLDLDAIGAALAVAFSARLEAAETNGLKQQIESLEGELDDADTHHGYLVDGDFSDDLA